jgi:hypothetical protein
MIPVPGVPTSYLFDVHGLNTATALQYGYDRSLVREWRRSIYSTLSRFYGVRNDVALLSADIGFVHLDDPS